MQETEAVPEYALLAAKMFIVRGDPEDCGMGIMQLLSKVPHQKIHPHNVEVNPEFLKKTLTELDPKDEKSTFIYIGKFGEYTRNPHYFLLQVSTEGRPVEELQKKYEEELLGKQLNFYMRSGYGDVYPLSEEERQIVDDWRAGKLFI